MEKEEETLDAEVEKLIAQRQEARKAKILQRLTPFGISFSKWELN